MDIPLIVLMQHVRAADQKCAVAVGADFVFEMPNHLDGYDIIVRSCRELLALPEDGEEEIPAG